MKIVDIEGKIEGSNGWEAKNAKRQRLQRLQRKRQRLQSLQRMQRGKGYVDGKEAKVA